MRNPSDPSDFDFTRERKAPYASHSDSEFASDYVASGNQSLQDNTAVFIGVS